MSRQNGKIEAEERFEAVLNRVTFPNMDFLLGRTGTRSFLQVQFYQKGSETGKIKEWRGRKWLLSMYMKESEIIQTALKAVLTAAEHEVRENFKVDGVSIFDPHYDINKLVELRKQDGCLSKRD